MSFGGFYALVGQFVTIIQIKPLTCLGISAKTRRAERAAAVGPLSTVLQMRGRSG